MQLRYATFTRTYRTKWSNTIKFRAASEFAECQTCHDLKNDMKRAEDPFSLSVKWALVGACAGGALMISARYLCLQDLASRVAATAAYREHMQDWVRAHNLKLAAWRVFLVSALSLFHFVSFICQDVMEDRALEEVLRSVPPWQLSRTLVIWTDGMDQAKWSIPRYKGLRPSKLMANFRRPKCKVQGVWCFHIGLHMYVMDADQQHDANSVVECLSRSLEKVLADCAQRGLPPPVELLLWVTLACFQHTCSA